MPKNNSTNGIHLSWLEIGVAVGMMFAASFIVFGASTSYGFLTFDDSYLIYGNLAAHAPTFAHIKQAFTTFDPELYIPVTLLSYQFNYLMGGLSGGIYHATNLVLHALNGALVSYLIFLLLGRKRIALFCGLLFVIHPLNTEAVSWLSGRKDLLSSFFYLSTLCLYLRYRYTGDKRMLIFAVGTFTLGLLSKVSILTLPGAILLLEALMRERDEWILSIIKNIAPFAILSTVFAAIALLGKERVLSSSMPLETILMAAKSTVFYVQKLIVPTQLSPIYPYTSAIHITSPDFYIPIIIIAVVVIISLMALRWSKWMCICALLFLMTLSPTFLNFHKGSGYFFAVDRYAYLPMIWVVLLLAVGIEYFSEKITRRWIQRGFTIFSLIVIIILSAVSMDQTKLWANDETLFTYVLTLYPESVSSRTSLSAVYREQGREREEISVLEEGMKLGKDVAYFTGIGSIAARQRKLTEAETLYNQARIFDPSNPEPLFFLGALEEQRGNPEKAIDYYADAIRFDSSYVAAYNNLGAIYLDQKKLNEAEKMFRSAITWNPNFMEGLYNLFQVLELQKKQDEAFRYLEKAYELNPDNAEITLSIAYRYTLRNRTPEAIRALQHLLALEPSNRTAERMLQQLAPDTAVKPEANTDERRQQRLLQRKQ